MIATTDWKPRKHQNRNPDVKPQARQEQQEHRSEIVNLRKKLKVKRLRCGSKIERERGSTRGRESEREAKIHRLRRNLTT